MYSPPDENARLSMKLSTTLWVGLVCVMFSFPARATAAPDDRHSSSASASADSATAAASVRDRRIKSERIGDRRPPWSRAQPNAVSKARTWAAVAPRRGIEKLQRRVYPSVGGGAEPVRALLNTQARGRPGRQSSRLIGSNDAAIGVAGLGGPAASKRNALPVAKATAMARNSPIGGPRVQSIGRLNGAALGRTNHSAVIDGTQFRGKF
jgi:hypothetical protein